MASADIPATKVDLTHAAIVKANWPTLIAIAGACILGGMAWRDEQNERKAIAKDLEEHKVAQAVRDAVHTKAIQDLTSVLGATRETLIRVDTTLNQRPAGPGKP